MCNTPVCDCIFDYVDNITVHVVVKEKCLRNFVASPKVSASELLENFDEKFLCYLN